MKETEGKLKKADRLFYLSIPPNIFTAVAACASKSASSKCAPAGGCAWGEGRGRQPLADANGRWLHAVCSPKEAVCVPDYVRRSTEPTLRLPLLLAPTPVCPLAGAAGRE